MLAKVNLIESICPRTAASRVAGTQRVNFAVIFFRPEDGVPIVRKDAEWA